MNFGLQNLDPQNLGAFSRNITFNQTSYDQYLKYHSGPYAAGKTHGLVFLALQHFTSTYKQIVNNVRSQVAVNFLPAIYKKDKRLLAGYEKQREILMRQYLEVDAAVGEIVIAPWGLTCIAHHKPLSRGTIMLNKTHPEAYPVVQWNTFQNPVDADVMVALTRYTRKHWARPELAVYKPVETAPGPQCQTDEEIIQCSIKEETLKATSAHLSGSCSMMPEDLGGCVGDDLLVYGVKHLSIVDASIMPMIPATHLQATLYAIAEKAADLIKKRA
jgi:choline dehydrogenase-like flavoprotein